MALIINEEQKMLKNSAKEFLNNRAPISQLRRLRDDKDPTGFDPTVWKEMAEMGWASLTIPEAYGGLDFGYVGLGQILEETGRTLTASPLVSTVLLGSTAVLLAGDKTQKETILPAVAAGEIILTMAMDESNHHQPFDISTSATKTDQGYTLTGKKVFVLDGHVANQIIVLARTSGDQLGKDGLSLFIVDASAHGIATKRNIMMDSRNAANIELNNVEIPASALLGKEGEAGHLVEKILDIARIGLSAEMLGSMLEVFERTMTYLKERQQFGVTIGSFQALQHRSAIMFGEIELCKSLVMKSLQAIDKGSKTLPVLASMTKAKVCETIQLVSNEGIQMFGGIGMTDDEEIGFFLKRARVAQKTFGDANYHFDRYATLNGY